MTRAWQFWIDRGGTFTDVVGVDPDGYLHVRKVLSAGVHDGDPGIAGARAILRAAGTTEDVPVAAFKVGTTVATNALLERRGEPLVLVITAGFADLLRIGYQNRPDIFARHIRRPEPLHAEVIEARERLAADGQVLAPLDGQALRQALTAARSRGLRSVAIVFAHGWRHARHECQAAAIARELGFEEVSVSHEISPLVRLVARGDTTVLNAYLAPPLEAYACQLRAELAALDGRTRLHFMQSSGGLVEAARFRAAASVLSGPAGGLVGMAKIGARLGIERLIGFDMGGTSTDVSLYDHELPRRFEHLIAGVRLQAPMLDVHTIAAGGGSVLDYADGRQSVGPRSAGAVPGPACYGRGGPATLTDVQVALGRLHAAFLPATFGPQANRPIDVAASRAAISALAGRIPAADAAGGQRQGESGYERIAAAWLDVAIESMANAIRHVATRQGLDPADFTLFSFGGAAGQHVCRAAEACGIRQVLIHPLASVLSAFGIGVADWLETRRTSVRLVLAPETLAAARECAVRLEAEARSALGRQDFPEASILIERQLELRAGDSEIALSVPDGPIEQIRAGFAAAHERRFGYAAGERPVVIDAVRVEARVEPPWPAVLTPEPETKPALPQRARAWFDGWCDVPVFDPARLHGRLDGPALLVDRHSTIVLEPDWSARSLPGGELLLECRPPAAATARRTTAVCASGGEGARLEIFNNLFMHVAEQMGAVLQQTAQSVNIKERLDFSCALFDRAGRLVANAPHMPVHLGSMGASVRAVLAARAGSLRPGEAVLLNSPYHGGTHLPDMTVVTPAFLSGGGAADFFVASRAHHADIGGRTPGSMPPLSRAIEEEGVLFADFTLVERGRFAEQELRAALARGPFPARNPDQNVADLRAQLAANARGIAELERAAARHGLSVLAEYMQRVQANAADCLRNALERLRPGAWRCEMDGGHAIAVRIDIDRSSRRARIDFTGTSPQGAHNFNAPRSVCIAAVLYVFRTLIDRPIPLNEGCLEPLEIHIPAGSLLDPQPPAAVVAGNVETSQIIVDALYGALGMLAASQGTMNNLTFGDSSLQYYETIAGGSGAGPGFAGCDAVQTHMTNSRLTDLEILEERFPVIVREFSIRRGSGGAGRWRGGDGVVRRLEFLAPLEGAMLANRRRTAPFGLAGGGDGTPGRTLLHRRCGEVVELDATAGFRLAPGDVLEVLTPGGGGFGAGPDDAQAR